MNLETASKITTSHLSRAAYLYVRQSTLRQVMENTESTQRQYALRQRAVALGSGEWPGGIAPPGSRRTRRKSLDLPGSHRPALGVRDKMPMSKECGLVLTDSLQPRPGP
jgi:hypothetical protein